MAASAVDPHVPVETLDGNDYLDFDAATGEYKAGAEALEAMKEEGNTPWTRSLRKRLNDLNARQAKAARPTAPAGEPRRRRRPYYQGARRAYRFDPRWDRVPTAVKTAVLEGTLTDADVTFAWVLYDHLRHHKGQGQRITAAELGARVKKSARSAEYAIHRMREAGILKVAQSGTGNQRGAIYAFRGRAEVAA